MDYFIGRVAKELGIDPPEILSVSPAEITASIERRISNRLSTSRSALQPSAKKRKTREVVHEATTEILPLAIALCGSQQVSIREATTTVLLSHVTDNLKCEYYPKLEQLRLLKLQYKGDKQGGLVRIDSLKDEITQLAGRLSTLLSIVFPKRLQDSSACVRLAVVSGLSSLGSTGLPTLKGSNLDLKMKPIAMMKCCLGDRDGSVRTAAINGMTHWLECFPKMHALFPVDDILGCTFDTSKTVQSAAVRFLATAASQDESVLDKLRNPDLVWHVLWDLEISSKAKEGIAKMVIKHIFPNSSDTEVLLRALIAFVAEFQPHEHFACIAARVFPAFSSDISLNRISVVAQICLDPSLEPEQLDIALNLLLWSSSQSHEGSVAIRPLLEICNSDIQLYTVASAAANLVSSQMRDTVLENFILNLCSTRHVIALAPLVKCLSILNPLRLSDLRKGSLPLVRACEITSATSPFLSDAELEICILQFPGFMNIPDIVCGLDLIATAALKRSNDEIFAKFFDCCYAVFSNSSRDVKIFASLRCIAMARYLKFPCPHASLISEFAEGLRSQDAELLLQPDECSWGTPQTWIAETLLRGATYSDKTAAVLAELISVQLSEF